MKTKIISSLLAVAILASSVPVYAMEATKSVESVEAVEEIEVTESIESTEETEAVEEVLAETTEATESAEETEAVEETEVTESAEETESVEVTESTESTDSVEEGTTEETVEDTESIDSEDLATSTEETTEEVTEELEVSDEILADAVNEYETIGAESLVVGKTYKVTLKSKQRFLLYDIPASTKTDEYAAVIDCADGVEVNGYLSKGTYKEFVDALEDTSCEHLDWYVSDGNDFGVIPRFNGTGTIFLDGNGTFNFTIVRLPSEVPDKDKLNIIPNADGTVTCKWQPTSDCDVMRVVVQGSNVVYLEKDFDKSITEYTFDPKTTNSIYVWTYPRVLAGDISIKGSVEDISSASITPVTIKAPKNTEVIIANDLGDSLDVSGSWVRVYDETGKRIYNGESGYYDVLKGKLHKYAGETLKVVSYNEFNTEDGQDNKITLRSKGSKPVYVDIPFMIEDDDEWERIEDEKSPIGYKLGFTGIYGAEKYEVQYKLGKDGKWKKAATLKSVDGYLKSTKPDTYYYRVRGIKTTSTDKTIKTKWSKSVKVTIKPSKVKSVKTTSKKAKQVKVTWGKQSGVTGYEVYCSTSKDGKYRKVATVTGKTSYTAKNKVTYESNGQKKSIKLKSGKTYYFKVRAYKEVSGSKNLNGSYSSVTKVKIK